LAQERSEAKKLRCAAARLAQCAAMAIRLTGPTLGLRPQAGLLDFVASTATTAEQAREEGGGKDVQVACPSGEDRGDKSTMRKSGSFGRTAESARASTPATPIAAEEGLVQSPSGSTLVDSSIHFSFGVRFAFWLVRPGSAGNMGEGKRDDVLQALGSCGDVHEFWRYWNSIRMDRLQPFSKLAVFREPERPRAGQRAPGGRYVVTVAEGDGRSSIEVFEHLVLALVGGSFDEDDRRGASALGVVLSPRHSPSLAVVELWSRLGAAEGDAPLMAQLRELLGSAQVVIDYHPHNTGHIGGKPSAKRTSK